MNRMNRIKTRIRMEKIPLFILLILLILSEFWVAGKELTGMNRMNRNKDTDSDEKIPLFILLILLILSEFWVAGKELTG